MRRLAKFTLEYCVSYHSESDETASVSCFNEWAEPLWAKFKESGFSDKAVADRLSQKFAFLSPLRDDFIALCVDKIQFHKLTVPLNLESSWLYVIQNINNAMREKQDKDRLQDFQKIALRYFDPYLTSESTLDDISFQFSEEDVREQQVEKLEEVKLPEIEMAIEDNSGEEKVPEILASLPDQQELNGPTEKSMRLSKRLNPGDLAPVDGDDILLIRRYFIETELFFNHLNESFKPILGVKLPVLNDIVGHIVQAEISDAEPGYIYDFLKILNEWKPQNYDTILFPEKTADSKLKSQSDKKRLIEVLTSFGNHFSDSNNNFGNLDETQDPEFVKKFITENFAAQCHVNEAKLAILLQLMASITTTTWDFRLYDAVSDWVMQLEPAFYNLCERVFRDHGTVKDFKLAMGIYEVLINCYIITKEKIELLLEAGAHTSFVKSVKTNFNTTTIELLRLKDRIDQWSKLFKGEISSVKEQSQNNWEFVIRYYWASNYYIAAKSFLWRDKKFVVVHLNNLAEIIKTISNIEDIQIAYPNYSKIGEFTAEGLQRRLSTSSILSIFSKILDQSDSETINTNDTISLLESILFDEDNLVIDLEALLSQLDGQESSLLVSSVIDGLAVLDRVSLSSVKEFFYECPVDLKLSLWNILFLYYQKESFHNFQKGLENYLQFIIEFLNSSAYRDFPEEKDKSSLLISLLASYRINLETFLNYLSDNKWRLPSSAITIRHLSNISRMFEICYTFSLHEESALYTSRKVSLSTKSEASFEYFKDFFIECITILLVYCFNYMDERNVEDKDALTSQFLIAVHHQLGLRQLCGSSKGLFLKFSEDSLVSLSKLPETELTQIMSCRYHYKVKLYGQFPVDHYTVKSTELNKASAEELAVFILPLCFRTNPLTQTPRNDLKQVVDDLFEIIGDPDVDNDCALSENVGIVEKFIDNTLIKARFIKECFYGLKSLEMLSPKRPNRVAQKGLYFLEAVLLFNSYKIRKKSAQSRTVELERIITILTYDLIYGSDRVESWVLLAQAYGYIVEDDLIWTSDKISTVERKVPTANLQRKSLVCYLMAISTITKHRLTDSEALKPVMNVLMNSFVKELYSASRSPMDMLAFQVYNASKFVRQNDKAIFLKVSDKPSVTTKFCLSLMDRCLDLAVRANSDDWSSLFYSAKVKAKLERKATDVLDTLLRSSIAAKGQSIPSDPILEPTYKYLSILYKYVKSGKVSVHEGFKYLNLHPILTSSNEFEGKNSKEFFQSIVSCLKTLLTLDKKAWYHKPAYRQAMIILAEFNDVKGAKELLSKYFTLRSNNKTFLQLWKPEYERPGKHFVYMFQYTKFFVLLLTLDQDLTSMALMYPKLRRANSTMMLLNVVWEQLCTLICTITRKVLDIDAYQVRLFLASMNCSTFAARANKVIEIVQRDDTLDALQKYLALLHVIADIRKLNNGFGPTALIDYTFTGIFIQIFQEVLFKNKEIDEMLVPDSPSAKPKRLAKKDLFPFTTELATKTKRSNELFLKSNPDILSVYVIEYEKEAELLRKKKAAEEEIQLIALQFKFQRLFAEQLILREQRKSMHKMVEFTVPSGWSNEVFVRASSNPLYPLTNTIDLCGPEELAANFNETRRLERIAVNSSIVSIRHSGQNTPIPTQILGTEARKGTTGVSNISNFQSYNPQASDALYAPYGNGGFGTEQRQILHLHLTPGGFMMVNPHLNGVTGNPQQSNVLHNFTQSLALYYNGQRGRESIAFRGTAEDPVEIDSDTNTDNQKRGLDTGEELETKRHKE